MKSLFLCKIFGRGRNLAQSGGPNNPARRGCGRAGFLALAAVTRGA
jgi:hypothetical protein